MKKNYTGSDLKIIACITMLLDHIAAIYIFKDGVFVDNISGGILLLGVIFRIAGRLSFTIFCYLMIEGYIHTHNKLKYCLRLFIAALISIVPFSLCFFSELINFSYQNTIFTLFIGLITISLIDYFSKFENNKYLFQICTVLFFATLSQILHFDYGFFGIIYIYSLYIFKNNRKTQFIVSSIPLFFSGFGQIIGSAAYFFISKYNGDQGIKMKYIFYSFYPAHLFAIYIIGYYLKFI